MTNKEALAAVIQTDVDDNILDKSFLDQNVTSSDLYVAANSRSIDLCAIAVLEGLLSTPNISEGGSSVNYDRNAILNRIKSLYNKVGLTMPSGATVSDKSSVW
jgi:hypothetical protein